MSRGHTWAENTPDFLIIAIWRCLLFLALGTNQQNRGLSGPPLDDGMRENGGGVISAWLRCTCNVIRLQSKESRI